MATDIEAFCRSCGKCQTNKTDTLKPQGFLHSLPIPDKLWQLVGMDFMGPLPWSLGNDYLLVIIDRLTLQVHLVPTTGFALFKLNQGYMPQIGMPTSFDTTFKGVKQFALQVKWDLMAAHNAIIANRVQQMFHANKKRRASDLYHVGDHMYLSTQNLTLPKGRARKLVPKYIGPYKVVKAHNEASTVTLELPPVLVA